VNHESATSTVTAASHLRPTVEAGQGAAVTTTRTAAVALLAAALLAACAADDDVDDVTSEEADPQPAEPTTDEVAAQLRDAATAMEAHNAEHDDYPRNVEFLDDYEPTADIRIYVHIADDDTFCLEGHISQRASEDEAGGPVAIYDSNEGGGVETDRRC
jgi:hypothetical protein